MPLINIWGEIILKLKNKLLEDVLEGLIMIILEENDMAGYEILNTIERKTEEIFKSKDISIFPFLYKLENKKYIENYWLEKDIPYKYYKITPKGRETLVEIKKDLYLFNNGLSNFLDSNIR
ncbi:MAG: hypothetical protein FH751_13680 [Firmicutes bacterium]|nr:hypothetical protein [Bacillota bacterium]